MTRIRGKPTVCERVALDKGKEYLDLFKKQGKGAIPDEIIPSTAGMALYIGCSKSFLEDKLKTSPKLQSLLNELFALQETLALNKGLKGKYNRYITGLVLNQYGYKTARNIEDETEKKPILLEISFSGGNEPKPASLISELNLEETKEKVKNNPLLKSSSGRSIQQNPESDPIQENREEDL